MSIVEKEAKINGQDTVKTVYSTTPQICGLNMPICLGQGSEDRILVADKLNNRVLAIHYKANLCQKVIRDGRLKNLRSHCYMDHHPVRLCLDKSKDLLFVALGGSYLNAGVICIFKEQKPNETISQETNKQINSVEPGDVTMLPRYRPYNRKGVSSESPSYKKELEQIKAIDARVNTVISGITVLSRKLYVVYEYCSTIEVYDHDTMHFDPKRSIFLEDYLTNPLDIASSKSSKCLYIVDLPNHKLHCRIKSANVDGEILNHWFVEDSECRLSVYESNVIACLPNRHEVIDYLKQGEVFRKITLPPSKGFDKLWHAIKVTETAYAVSHSVPQSYEHRVTIVESHGTPTIKTSYFSSVTIAFSTTPNICGMNKPICLARDRKGRILVAEYLNNRVLLIDPISTDCEVILRDGRFKNVKSRCSIEHDPVRMCLDERSERLFIALCCPTLKAGIIVAFKVQDTESA